MSLTFFIGKRKFVKTGDSFIIYIPKNLGLLLEKKFGESTQVVIWLFVSGKKVYGGQRFLSRGSNSYRVFVDKKVAEMIMHMYGSREVEVELEVLDVEKEVYRK